MTDEQPPRHDLLDKADEIIARNNVEKVKIKRHGKWMELFRTILIVIVLVVVLDHFHAETSQQLQETKNAPQEIAAIIDQAVCPGLLAVNSYHSTPLRRSLIKQYCPPMKGKS